MDPLVGQLAGQMVYEEHLTLIVMVGITSVPGIILQMTADCTIIVIVKLVVVWCSRYQIKQTSSNNACECGLLMMINCSFSDIYPSADLGDNKYPTELKCSEALKWVVHFIGDVAQPLHTSERSYGGNSIKVKFNGTDTNLHSVWDKEILYAETGVNPFPADEIHPYFTNLVSRIVKDEFRSPTSGWSLCDLDANRGTYCAEQWAKDSNSIVCDYAYGRYVNGSDLWTGPEKYADGALHIIEEQMAKGAFRLAGWLNALAASTMGSAHVSKQGLVKQISR